MYQLNADESGTKAFARKFSETLKRKGVPVKHSLVLEALAEMAGQRDWNALSASLKRSRLSIAGGQGGNGLSEMQSLEFYRSFFCEMAIDVVDTSHLDDDELANSESLIQIERDSEGRFSLAYHHAPQRCRSLRSSTLGELGAIFAFDLASSLFAESAEQYSYTNWMTVEESVEKLHYLTERDPSDSSYYPDEHDIAFLVRNSIETNYRALSEIDSSLPGIEHDFVCRVLGNFAFFIPDEGNDQVFAMQVDSQVIYRIADDERIWGDSHYQPEVDELIALPGQGI